MKTNPQEYRQIMVRPLDLAMCECWDTGERINLPRKFKELLYFDPLFIYKPGKAVTVYYNFTDPKQNLNPLIEFLENNPAWLLEQKKMFDADCGKARQAIKDESADAGALRRTITEIWPMIAVANVLGSTESYVVSQSLREVCVKVRNESDDVLHPALTLLSAGLKEKISKARPWLAGYCSYISLSEFMSDKFPDQDTLAKSPAGIDWRDKSARFYLCTIFKAAENDPQAIIGYRSIGRKVANGYLNYIHFCGWGRSFFCLERKNPLGSMKELKWVTRRMADFRN